MNRHQLDELQTELLSQGYSRNYIRRLVEELEDHCYATIADSSIQTDDDEENELDLERLGTREALVEAVRGQEALLPWPKRYPVLFYSLIPGIMMMLLTFLSMLAAHNWLIGSSRELRAVSVQWIQGLQYLVIAVVPMVTVWATLQYRVSMIYALVSVGLACLSSLFTTGVAQCGENASPFVFSKWGFDLFRFSLPLVSCIAVVAIVRLVSHVDLQFSWTNIRPSRFVQMAIVIAILATGFCFGVKRIGDVSRPHSLDGMMEKYVLGWARAHRLMEILSYPNVMRELKATEEQVAKADAIIKDCAQKRTESYQRINSFQSLSSESEIRAKTDAEKAEVNRLMIKAAENLKKVFSSDQQERIREIVYQAENYNLLFLPEVRNEIDMTKYQLEYFKSLRLETQLEFQTIRRKYSRATDEEKPKRWDELIQFRSGALQLCESMLTDRQSKQLNRLRGPKVPFDLFELR